MIIDHQAISTQALEGLVKEYVIANIADSDPDIALDEWTEKVIAAVKSGELLIEYSESNESVYLKSADSISVVPELK